MLAALTVLLLLGMLWVWQGVSTRVVLTPDIIVHHPTSAMRIKTLTAQALQSAPTATPAAFVPSRVVITTPRAEFL